MSDLLYLYLSPHLQFKRVSNKKCCWVNLLERLHRNVVSIIYCVNNQLTVNFRLISYLTGIFQTGKNICGFLCMVPFNMASVYIMIFVKNLNVNKTPSNLIF